MSRVAESAPDWVRSADLFGALSLAADLAIGLPAEHVLRSCYIGMRLADELSLPAAERVDLYYAGLLMDVGCTAWTSHFAAFLLGDEIMARREFVYFLDTSNPLAMLGWTAADRRADHHALRRRAAHRATHPGLGRRAVPSSRDRM